jgi:hypothetical protein
MDAAPADRSFVAHLDVADIACDLGKERTGALEKIGRFDIVMVVSAPITIFLSRSPIERRLPIRPISITTFGCESRSFIAGIKL